MLLRNHAIRENPVLELPLKTSLVPARGSATPVFTRASTATCMGYAPDAVAGASQVLLTCAANEARFQGARRISEGVWDNKLADGTLIPDSQIAFLDEEASTNLLTYSEDFSNGAWAVKTNVTVTGSVADPFGGTTAFTVAATTPAVAVLQQAITGTAGSTYTGSIWIRRRSGSGQINFRVGDVTAIPVSITSTWVRVYKTTVAGSTTVRFGIYFSDAASTDSVDICFAQLENVTAKSYKGPSSYIPTTTADVTRAADALSYTSTPFSNTQGTALIDIEAADWATVAGQYLGDGTEAVMRPSTANRGIQAFDGTNTANGPSGTPTGRMKFAVTWGNGVMQCFANGQAGAVQSYDGSFNLDSFIVGSGFEGGMRNLRLFKSRLPAAKIQRLTS